MQRQYLWRLRTHRPLHSRSNGKDTIEDTQQEAEAVAVVIATMPTTFLKEPLCVHHSRGSNSLRGSPVIIAVVPSPFDKDQAGMPNDAGDWDHERAHTARW
jgi:hypothetical protein